MERKNLTGSAPTAIGRSSLLNRAASRRGVRLAPLLLTAVMLAAVALLAETLNPAQTAHAHEGDDHRHACTSPPDDRCPGYGDVGGERTVWSTTMTVGLSSTTIGLATADRAGFAESHGSMISTQLTYEGTSYSINQLRTEKTTVSGSVASDGLSLNLSPLFPTTAESKLVLELDGTRFALADASRQTNFYSWVNHGLNWADNDPVAVRLIELPTPNAYGYRTLWTTLLTAEEDPNNAGSFGYRSGKYGAMTNDLIVTGRDESIRVGTPDQPRFPWTGYEIEWLVDLGTELRVQFPQGADPDPAEVAGWTLTLGAGVELPFADATQVSRAWKFSYDPGWAAGDQVVVSIRTGEVQNRVGQVRFKSRRNAIRTDQTTEKIVYGKTHFSYDHEPDKFGPADGWELLRVNVITDKTGDTDPVWVTATFRAHGAGAAERAYQGYWEGEFEDFHTLLLSWAYSVDGAFIGGTTYTLPLRAADGIGYRAKYDGRPDNYHVSGGHDVTFTWVRTYKEFKDKHLDLANHGGMNAHMLGAPQPATARLTVVDDAVVDDGDPESNVYDPVTVKGLRVTSDPGADHAYGPGDTVEVTVTFSEVVTVGYKRSKKHAAEIDLELGDRTRTAHYARTEGRKVIFEYTVVPGDEAPVVLRVPVNSLRLYRDEPSEHGSIRDSDGRDVHLDHAELASQAHLVDAVSPQFAGAEVSADGTQVVVTFNESIKSPAILRWFGVQTSLLQSLALDVRVDGEVAALSDAALSGDTVTLTMEEPITQGQTVTASYDNPFVRGESVLVDLRSNKLLAFTNQPATNNSAVADATRPGGGLVLSRTDINLYEGRSGTYTVALASQPTSEVAVTIEDHPPGRATVTPTGLTFTTDNWNTPQTVTITSDEDANYLPRWLVLRHTAAGADYRASALAWLTLMDSFNVGTTPPNNRPTGSPTIDGTPQVDHTLTADISDIADADGLTHASYTWLYQWLRGRSEIRGATDSTYTLGLADKGHTIRVKVSFTDDANNQESRTSAATVAVAPPPNSPPTGLPAITGTPQVGETLTADISAIDDADGLTSVAYRYQWVGSMPVIDFNTGTTHYINVDMPGETGSTYTLARGDEGRTFAVKVSFTDDAGHTETLTSRSTVAVAAPPNYEPTGLPAITGTPQVGETLTADTSAIGDADGLANVAYRYQWLHNQSVLDANTGTYYYTNVDMPGETGSTYTLGPADWGRTFAVKVSFTDDRGNSESLTSRSTVIVAARPNSEPTGLPAVNGTPQVGQTLTADTSAIDDADGLTNVSYRYRWRARKTVIDENTGTSFPVVALLSADTSSTYTLGPADAGYTFEVNVSFADDEGNNESLTSIATQAVAATVPTAPQSLSVTTRDQDQELEASWQAPSSNGGSAVTGYKVQWKEAEDSWDTAADVSEATQTGTTHTITALTGGVEYSVRVIATNNAGDGPASTEAKGTPAGGVSEQVAEPENSAPTGLPTVSGTPQVDQTLTADTSPIDDADGLTNATFEYQWIAGGSDIGGATGSTYTLTASEQGKTVQVRVTFTDDANNAESLTSEATAEVTAALTVSVTVSAPATHDGSSEFTFEIEFSEEFGLSYRTLKFDAFNVTGGSVEKAQRTDKPSNIPWLITVKPQGNGDVTITLPATTNCDADGAICTGDARKLSNSLSITVTGPGS